jgi:zinc transport system permease protein
MAYLFGNVLTVTWTDVAAIGAFAALVIALLWRYFWPLVFVSFDEEAARLARVPAGRLTLLLLLLLALTVALSIRTVGLLLVSALLVIPGAAAQRVTASVHAFLAVSLGVGLASALGGLALSFAADLPSGAAIVLVAGALFAAAMGVRRQS